MQVRPACMCGERDIAWTEGWSRRSLEVLNTALDVEAKAWAWTWAWALEPDLALQGG